MLALIARFVLRLFGWTVEGEVPEGLNRCVMIGAPHTSNWDFPLFLLAGLAYSMKVRWLGKDSLFNGTSGLICRLTGGISVDRSGANDTVSQVVAVFERQERLFLTLSPEGTRKKTEYWRSGFYYIAKGAGVPILLGFADYKRKILGIGKVFAPAGDLNADMMEIRAFYSGVQAKHPELVTPVRLKEESSINK
ncbi:MAG: acyltransferase [Proteobacteria bacterium]|nr:acyltransferase [Pseudomonadota bacterium]